MTDSFLGDDALPRTIDLGIAGIADARPLNSGGNAIVYVARQPAMDRDVVVKILRAANDPSVKRRFDREQKAMGRLSDHRGIVPVYQSGVTINNDPYLVMPFFERGSLQDELQESGRFDPERARLDLIAICDALQAAHDKGVLHRDLKPGNILRSNDGRPVLADFGIARIMDTQSSVSTALTLTPLYSPPEVFEGAMAAVSQDVYGLGAVLFALLNGKAAFDRGDAETSVLALMRRVTDQPLPALPSDVPLGVVAAVRRAMSKKPGDRFETVAAFGEALRTAHDYQPPAQLPRRQITSRPDSAAAGNGAAGGGYTNVIRPLQEAKPQRSKFPLVGAALAGIALAAVGGFLLWQQRDGQSAPEIAAEPAIEATAAPTTSAISGVADVQSATATPVDLAVIADALAASAVTIEGAACGNGFDSPGVLLPDQRVLVPARYANTAWVSDVTSPTLASARRVEEALVWPEVGMLRTIESAESGNAPGAEEVVVGATLFVTVPGSPAPNSGRLSELQELAGMLRISADLAEDDQPSMSGRPVVDSDGLAVGIVTDVITADTLAVAFDPTVIARQVVSLGGAPDHPCPAAGGDVFPPGSGEASSSGRVASFLLAQRLAHAFAREDWTTVREIEPAKASYADERFDEGWGVVDVLTLFPLRANDRNGGGIDGIWDWRFGLVAHETQASEQVTTAFCVSWSIDLASGTVVQTSEDSVVIRPADEPEPGWVDPPDFVPEFVAARC